MPHRREGPLERQIVEPPRGCGLVPGSRTMMTNVEPIQGSTASGGSSTIDRNLLLAIARRRDLDAFTRLYHRYERPYYAISLRVTGNGETGRDAVQDAMLRVWVSAKTFDPEMNARGWLLKIIFHQCLQLLKSTRRHGPLDPQMAAPMIESSSQNEERKREQAAVQNRMQGLPHLDRTILEWYYAGHSQDRIARKIEMPQRTVSYRIQKSLQALRRDLCGTLHA